MHRLFSLNGKLAALLAVITASVFLALAPQAHAATNYYVSSLSGCSDGTGYGTSPSTPWCSFANVNSMPSFEPGDTINLACGASWTPTYYATIGDIHPVGSGTSGSPITITSYAPLGGSCTSTNQPLINGNSTEGEVLIKLTDQSWWTIENLELKEAKVGILASYDSGVFGNQGITIANNYIHDLVPYGNPSGDYTIGIEIMGAATPLPTSSQYTLSGINIIGNSITACQLGVFSVQGTGGPPAYSQYSFQNLTIRDNYIWDVNDRSIILYGITNGLIMDNYLYYNAFDANPTNGVAANFLYFGTSVTWVNNYIDDVIDSCSMGECSPDEAGMDIEGFDIYDNVWNNYIGDTYGPGIEVLALGPPGARPGDYSTDNTFQGNTFYGDGTETTGKTTPGSSIEALESDGSSGPTITLSLLDNISYQANSDFFSKYTSNGPIFINSETDDLGVASGSVYNYAQDWINNGDNGLSNTLSGTQTEHGWKYRTYNGAENAWTDMTTYTAGVNGAAGVWTSTMGGYVGLLSMQAPSSTSNANGMEWTAPSTGTVSMRGRVLMETTGGSGVNAYWSHCYSGICARLWNEEISGSNQTGYDLTNDNISVTAGDIFRFMVFPLANDDPYAIVSWQPTMTYVPSSTETGNLLLDPTWPGDDFTDWTVGYCCGGSSSDAYLTSGGGYDGDPYVLNLDSTTGSFGISVAQTDSSLTSLVGHFFTASVYVETSATTTGAYLNVYDGAGNEVCSTIFQHSVSSWTQYMCTGTVPSTGKLNFALGNDGPADAWAKLDSPSLTVQ